MHAFVIKRNRFFMNQRRFIILTKHFLINVEAEFTDNTCTDVKYDSLKWKVPIKAMNGLQLSEDKEFLKISVFFDIDELNRVMAEHGATKKQKKDKRSLKFADPATARDFLFHLKRLHHEHNCSKLVPFDQVKKRV